jgi:hypothetical protein
MPALASRGSRSRGLLAVVPWLLGLLLAVGCNQIVGNDPVTLRPQNQTPPPASQLAVCDAGSCVDAAPVAIAAAGGSGAGRTSAGAGGEHAVAKSCSMLSCGESADCIEGVAGMESARCQCKTGFIERAGACMDMDECQSNRGGCGAHATCVNLPGRSECECQAGYQHPEAAPMQCVSLCEQAQCDAHASCAVVGDVAQCTCLSPYVGDGKRCSEDTTCADYKCDPNARCVNGGVQPCVCSDGFEGDGKTCTRVDPCKGAPCQHAGRCAPGSGMFTCDCAQTGYRGQTCEEPIDDCSPNPCVHGSCADLVNGYQCDCAAGYEGESCEINRDDCAQAPCVRGQCIDLVGDYKCECPTGFSGKDCSNNVDDCSGAPCARGTCVDQVNGYKCECPPGYDGVNCENNVDECMSKPCVHGSCSDQVNGYKCACQAGYAGKNCEMDVDECASKPCVHGSCADQVNGYKCACEAGWGGARCDAGSCANLKCPSSAPCRVPAGNPGMCYPSACGTMAGLCIAQNADGSGDASTELLTQDNSTWNFGSGNNWNNRCRYFAYIKAVSSQDRVCVFPSANYAGTAVGVPLGRAVTRPAAFGQSNAFSAGKCPKP